MAKLKWEKGLARIAVKTDLLEGLLAIVPEPNGTGLFGVIHMPTGFWIAEHMTSYQRAKWCAEDLYLSLGRDTLQRMSLSRDLSRLFGLTSKQADVVRSIKRHHLIEQEGCQ